MTELTESCFSPIPKNVHWGFFDASLPAIGAVDSGEIFRVKTVSSVPPGIGLDEFVHPEAMLLNSTHKNLKGIGGHFLTGPIQINGARSGDVLEVRLIDISMRTPYAFQKLHPLWGLLKGIIDQEQHVIVPIDLEEQVAEVIPGVRVPCKPFFGIIGLSPRAEWGKIGSYEPRINGGNMDNQELIAGSRLFLPVQRDDAMLSFGDGHARQGDGEVCSTALETSLEARVQTFLHPDLGIKWPFAISPTHLITMDFDPALDVAAIGAVERMLILLKSLFGFETTSAYRLCSAVADLHITQVVNKDKGVHYMMPLSALKDIPGKTNLSLSWNG